MATRHTKPIDQDVMDVLNRSVISERSLKLPEQLDRKLYERTMKVITVAGGKWNRSAAAHIFDKDPRTVLGLALETGTITDEKVRLQQFFTPTAIADMAVRELREGRILRTCSVLEPSCGNGQLVKALIRQAVHPENIEACELDRDLAFAVRREHGVSVFHGDFMKYDPLDIAFDLVIMNPPFSNGQDLAHVTKAFGHLSDGGKLVAIMSPSFTFAENKKAQAFRELLDTTNHKVTELPPGSFTSSGTGVNTVMITLWK